MQDASQETAIVAAIAQHRLRDLERSELTQRGSMFSGIREHFSVPGSQSRLWLTARAAALLGAPHQPAGVWAAACELVHNASLIHDDLQDQSECRRGVQALWSKHGANQAICAGDYVLTLAFRLLAQIEDSALAGKLSAALSTATVRVIAGQSWELDWDNDPSPSIDDYRAIVRGKAGALFALPLIGVLNLAGAAEEEVRRVETAAELFGAAYQCFDDMRDLFAVPAAESDLAKGSLNAGLVLALKSLDKLEAAKLANHIRSDHRPAEQTEQWIVRIRDLGVPRACVQQIANLRVDAGESLRGAPIEIARLIEGLFASISSDAARFADTAGADPTETDLQAA